MKIAILTITDEAQNLAKKISYILEKDPTITSIKIFNKNVKKALVDSFNDYDCLIGIMAMGIMIRNICPLIKNKINDPAILVMDDHGKHVISMLSGHFGGANEITLKIAGLTGAKPIITTATDIHGKIGIDSIARKYYLSIEESKNIKQINSALICNKVVELHVPLKYDYILKDPGILKSYKVCSSVNGEFKAIYNNSIVKLKPRRFVVGVGARKEIPKYNVLNAINQMMSLLKLPVFRIDYLATAEIKKNEKGIIDAANDLNIPLKIVTLQEIKSLNHPDISHSNFVYKKFDIPGVCEPTALIVAGKGSRLIFKKDSHDGVTVAAAISNYSN